MRAFIVRPFGQKEGIDFDRVEQLLIQPALRAAGASGATTEELVRQGNIREDMFALLLKYDLVVADMSIHNANVFYELGVRHALRDRHTFLIRCKKDEVPFDLRTDRYLEYDAADPEAALPRLIEGLRRTVESSRADSPVFKLVSGIQAQDWTRFLSVPRDFSEEVARAAGRKRKGDLDLLASEIEGLEWEIEGLKQIGRELYSLRFDSSAREVWERVVAIKDDDPEAWASLASVYQHLDDFAGSERAVQRALGLPMLAPNKRAEIHSLRGSNGMRLWAEEWDGLDDPKERRKAALASPHLKAAYEAYEQGFADDLNHAQAGLNALALLVVTTELAGSAEVAGEWANLFESDEEAATRLHQLQERRKDLEVVVRCTLNAVRGRVARGERDVRTEVGLAELHLLTGQSPFRVARAYGEALMDEQTFDIESVRQKLRIFDRLGLLGSSPGTALAKLDVVEAQSAGSSVHSGLPPIGRILLFTGHMIDEAGRARPRFPAAAEPAVRDAIRKVVGQEVQTGPVLGIAGGACGGDILFHEVCIEFKPKALARLYLSVPPERYVPDRVDRGDGAWVTRFYRLCPPYAERNPRVLGESKEIPNWLREKRGYGLRSRYNAWMLFNALVRGSEDVKLIALWDGEPADEEDGTADMVQLARTRGIEVIHLDIRKMRPN